MQAASGVPLLTSSGQSAQLAPAREQKRSGFYGGACVLSNWGGIWGLIRMKSAGSLMDARRGKADFLRLLLLKDCSPIPARADVDSGKFLQEAASIRTIASSRFRP
jgi:hypothetical protein